MGAGGIRWGAKSLLLLGTPSAAVRYPRLLWMYQALAFSLTLLSLYDQGKASEAHARVIPSRPAATGVLSA